MGKSLVIVESPAKCKKIESYLGDGYRCIASYGHIQGLDTVSYTHLTLPPIYSV